MGQFEIGRRSMRRSGSLQNYQCGRLRSFFQEFSFSSVNDSIVSFLQCFSHLPQSGPHSAEAGKTIPTHLEPGQHRGSCGGSWVHRCPSGTHFISGLLSTSPRTARPTIMAAREGFILSQCSCNQPV